MAQNITLLGASYSAVPAVTLPKTGGGSATFTDVSDTTAAASDVASGKYFYTAAGTRTQGTASGGGGSDRLVLLQTTSLGSLSTSSTSATDTGKSISVSGASGYDLLIVEVSVDSITNGRHVASGAIIMLTGTSNFPTRDAANILNYRWNCKVSSAGAYSTRQSTTAYGVYPYGCTLSNGTATITLYMRYNNTQTGTINGTYTARVYGLKLYDLIGG